MVLKTRGPVALDLAVTCALRWDVSTQVLTDAAGVLEDYADFKRTHLDTMSKCTEQGINFIPLIFEAHGGGWAGGTAAATAARNGGRDL